MLSSHKMSDKAEQGDKQADAFLQQLKRVSLSPLRPEKETQPSQAKPDSPQNWHMFQKATHERWPLAIKYVMEKKDSYYCHQIRMVVPTRELCKDAQTLSHSRLLNTE